MRKNAWIFIAVLVLCAGGAALWILGGGVQGFKMSSASMMPTIEKDSRVLMDPAENYALMEMGGAVAVFREPETGEQYVKRLVALPGQTIEIRGKDLLLDGASVTVGDMGPFEYAETDPEGLFAGMARFRRFEERVGRFTYSILRQACTSDQDCRRQGTACDTTAGICSGDFGPVKVPEGQVFMLGDNRDNSMDSRRWGPVRVASIVGYVPTGNIKKQE